MEVTVVVLVSILGFSFKAMFPPEIGVISIEDSCPKVLGNDNVILLRDEPEFDVGVEDDPDVEDEVVVVVVLMIVVEVEVEPPIEFELELELELVFELELVLEPKFDWEFELGITPLLLLFVKLVTTVVVVSLTVIE